MSDEPDAASKKTSGPVHMRDGYGHLGSKVRAYCSCGYSTTPRVSEPRAVAALVADHELDPPVCALCERDRGPALDPGGRWRDLAILTIPPSESASYDPPLDVPLGTQVEQVLVCRTDTKTCLELAQQHQLHLDRAMFEAFGLDFQPPPLRALPGGQTGTPGKGLPT